MTATLGRISPPLKWHGGSLQCRADERAPTLPRVTWRTLFDDPATGTKESSQGRSPVDIDPTVARPTTCTETRQDARILKFPE